MKIGFHIEHPAIFEDARFRALEAGLRAGGAELYGLDSREALREGTAMVLSLGGDGTFLSTAHLVAEAGVPILGVNFGRMGFLSENSPEAIVAPILEGRFTIEERAMLKVEPGCGMPADFWPYALNEAGLYRTAADMLGIDASIGDMALPTYWADGLMVATASGSTAYNLSSGGPICLPESEVLLLTAIAPHNLGIRPMVVPAGKVIRIAARARSGAVSLSMDNRCYGLPSGTPVSISSAPFRLKRVDLGLNTFIDALRERLFWGQDVRNMPL